MAKNTRLGFITQSVYVPPMEGKTKLEHSFHTTHRALHSSSMTPTGGSYDFQTSRHNSALHKVSEYHKEAARDVERDHIKKHIKSGKPYHTAFRGAPAVKQGEKKFYVSYKQKKKKKVKK